MSTFDRRDKFDPKLVNDCLIVAIISERQKVKSAIDEYFSPVFVIDTPTGNSFAGIEPVTIHINHDHPDTASIPYSPIQLPEGHPVVNL